MDKNTEDMLEKFKEYFSLHFDEVSEVNEILYNLAYREDFVSKEFYEALMKEIQDALIYYMEYSKIVETEETVTRKFKELEWI